MKILLVCLGNICRSPMAEGILRNKIEQRGLSFTVDSAGTSDYHVNDCPDIRAIRTAEKYGVDISKLKGRQFDYSDFNIFDRIYAMDRSNYNDIISLARDEKDIDKVFHFLIDKNTGADVPDPWFGDEAGFIPVYKLIEKRCDEILDELIATE